MASLLDEKYEFKEGLGDKSISAFHKKEFSSYLASVLEEMKRNGNANLIAGMSGDELFEMYRTMKNWVPDVENRIKTNDIQGLADKGHTKESIIELLEFLDEVEYIKLQTLRVHQFIVM